MVILPALEPIEPPPSDLRQLREWWHQIIREHGYYRYVAILVALSADQEVDAYLLQHTAELDRVSGKNCLVIVYSQLGFVSIGSSLGLWNLVLSDHARQVHTAALAHLFGVMPADFPCLFFFRRIPSQDHVLVSLKGLNQDEIADVLRSNFAALEKAVSRKKDSLLAIGRNRNNRALLRMRDRRHGDQQRLVAGGLRGARS